MQLDEISINKKPKFMVTNPTIKHHIIHIPDKDITFTLAITGIISYLPTGMSTEDELNINEHEYIRIIQPSSDWNHHNPY